MNTARAKTAGASTSVPARVAGSVRRTTSIDMTMQGELTLTGRARDDLRTRIRADFVGASTCTHLNDMLRALEDVAALARPL